MSVAKKLCDAVSGVCGVVGRGDPGRTAEGGAGGAAGIRFNKEEINSESSLEDGVILPEFSGGRLDPEGGKAARLAALRKFEALGRRMDLPVFMTLTPDRANFAGPEAAYKACSLKLSELLSQRLGITVWARVAEVQTKSGNGWIHWHVLADVGGTAFDLSAQKGRAWVDLSALRSELMHSWCMLWKLGGVGGQDVQPVRKREAVAGYLSKYVAKPWPAIPVWILERTFLRTVGFSRGANVLLRSDGSSAASSAGGEETDSDSEEDSPGRTKRPVRKLLERLALSGLMSKVVSVTERAERTVGRYVGRLGCSASDLLPLVPDFQAAGVPIRVHVREYHNVYRGRCSTRSVARAVLDLAGRCGREVVGRMNRLLTEWGLDVVREARFHERLSVLLDGWDLMQSAKC